MDDAPALGDKLLAFQIAEDDGTALREQISHSLEEKNEIEEALPFLRPLSGGCPFQAPGEWR